MVDHYSGAAAVWILPFKPLPNLVAGPNDIGVVIGGDCDSIDYFSMVITTDTCGYPSQ